jgi:hypothetical protein
MMEILNYHQESEAAALGGHLLDAVLGLVASTNTRVRNAAIEYAAEKLESRSLDCDAQTVRRLKASEENEHQRHTQRRYEYVDEKSGIFAIMPRGCDRRQTRQAVCSARQTATRERTANLQRGRGEKMRKQTIYEALKKKLGREPYNNEIKADVLRILREGREEREGKCGTRKSSRRKKKKTFGSSVTATGIRS